MVGLEFDRLEDGYTDKIRRWVPFYDDLLKSLFTTLPTDFRPKTILDLGAGNGNVTFLAMQVFPEADYVLVDASAKMINHCAQRFGGADQFIYKERYFQELSFLSQSLDLIVAGLSLHHLQAGEKQALFRSAYEWLRPGGIFTAADLYVDKTMEEEHEQVLQDWERIAREQGSTTDDWEYLMDHYQKYDFPHSFEDQLQWLHEAQFKTTKIVWVQGAWGTIQAIKD